MNEDEARDWIRERFGAEAVARLTAYTELLLAEAERQSLIARSTFDLLWSRHIVDSAQLVLLAPVDGRWIDVGSGGGLPGIVVALLRSAPTLLVEPRRKRAEFLAQAIAALRLHNCAVAYSTVQKVGEGAKVISARAVASPDLLFDWSAHLVSRETVYLLPRGAHAAVDLDIIDRAWQGRFHVEQSLTDPNSGIIVARDVARR
ncbi:MAG: 16S rRNA (guanine(527)-N(7))-methyltransferase RsmG [Pseudomonadota bacterium]